MGHTVLGKTIRENFKSKKRRKARPDELMIFPNTHEAIVDEETWNNVQRLRRRTKRTLADGTSSHRLSGLVYCSDCGKRLSYSSPQCQHRDNGKIYDADSNFRCPTYKSMYGECTMHFVKASVLEVIVKTAIRRVAQYVMQDEENFVKQVKELSESIKETAYKDSKKEIISAEKRISELSGFIKKLYEGNATGKIPDRHFNKLLAEYDEEQQTLEARVSELESKIRQADSEVLKADSFVKLVRKYCDFTEITTSMLNEFIEKIVVHEATGGRTKNRHQKIDIYFNFIGRFEVPLSENEIKTMEEESRQQKIIREQQRRECRNATVRKYQKKKREQAKAEAV
jgi:hypothetical protein